MNNHMRKYILLMVILFSITTLLNSLKITNVYPTGNKQAVDIFIKKGETINIESRGAWSLWDKYKEVGPVGHDFIANEFGNWGVLMGQIGKGEPFIIGKNKQIVSQNEGLLYLFPNKGKYKIINESGQLEVTITGGTELDKFKKELGEQGTTYTFNAENDYLFTDLYVTEGEELKIYTFGSWTMWNGSYPQVNADGHELVIDDISWGQLHAGIGSTLYDFLETFPIGQYSTITPEYSGVLSFYPFIGNYIASKAGSLEIYVIGGKAATASDKEGIDEYVRKRKELELITVINQFRADANLPEITENSSLSVTAQSHARYMAENNKFSRNEEEGLPYYTGSNPTERAKAKGLLSKIYEMYFQSESALTGLNIYINSIYHRLRLMHPYLSYAGYGHYKNDKNIHVMDLGYEEKEDEESKYDVVMYPGNNATNIAYAWSGYENPDPFPAGTIKPLGYPVTIMFMQKLKTVVKATLTTENDPYTPLNCFIITPDTDLNSKQINAVILVSKKTLDPMTKYNAEVVVELDNDIEEEQTFTWTFTTSE